MLVLATIAQLLTLIFGILPLSRRQTLENLEKPLRLAIQVSKNETSFRILN